MTDTTNNRPFRTIPSLDSLLREDPVRALIEEFGRDVVVAEGRAALDEARARLNLSRKYAQAILEYFDKTGLTKRVEDRHVLAKP
jgi:hypothetical protein